MALALLWPVTARAQQTDNPYGEADAAPAPAPAPSPQDAAKAKAKQLLDAGLSATQEGDFAAALDAFVAAYAVYPSAKLLINIGTCLRALGRPAEAAASYERYLASPDASPDRARELTALLAQIDKLVAWAAIDVSEPGAELRVDGNVMACVGGTARVRLDPGAHTFVAEKGDLLPAIATVALLPGEQRTVRLTLRPKPKPVTIEVRDYRAQRTTGLAIGGAGLIGVAAGAVLGGLAIASNHDASEHCSAADPTACDANGAVLGARASAEATAATVSLALGAAAFVAGAVVFAVTPKTERRVEAGLSPGGFRLIARW